MKLVLVPEEFFMKCLTLVLIGIAATATACTKRTVSVAVSIPKYEEITNPVPSHFAEATQWNDAKTCPEGTVLSPLTRYTYGPRENSYGFTHYFGRFCGFVRPHELEASKTLSASVVPHGPFIWWYESGKKMSAGTFDHGTLATDWSRWEPDGSLAAK